MNFKAELTAMKGRLFSPELYQAMGEASTQRRRERGLTWKDAIWRRAQAQLDPQLTPDQKDRLDQLRRQCQETGEYAAVVAFQNGLYTGFQQYFQRDTSDTPYQDFLRGTLLQYTSPKRKTLFRARLEDDQAQADALTLRICAPPSPSAATPGRTSCGTSSAMASTWATGSPWTPWTPPTGPGPATAW